MMQNKLFLFVISFSLVGLIYFVLVLRKKYQNSRVIGNISNAQIELLEEKSEYLQHFGKNQKNLFRLLYALALIIPLIVLLWLNTETYSMKFLDKETIQARVQDTYMLSGFLFIVMLIGAKVIISVLKENYNGFKPIILNLSKSDWQTFIKLQKKLIALRNSLPYYIFSGNTISVYSGWKVKTYNISDIQSFENYGLVSYSSGSVYESKIRFYNNQIIKFAINMKEEEIHEYLVSRLSKYSA